MGHLRVGLSIVAVFALAVAAKPAPAAAASAAALALGADASVRAAAGLVQPAFHAHRTQSFYCYPKNYWWFYRPYTTGLDGHPRCMPYFHYLGPDGRRGEKSDRYIK
jgi:hypothetical protein